MLGYAFSDQFSYVGNRARYEFIELDISTGLDEQINLKKPYSVCRVMWATELGTGLSSSISRPASMDKSTSTNRTRYVDTELDSSRTVNKELPFFRGDK